MKFHIFASLFIQKIFIIDLIKALSFKINVIKSILKNVVDKTHVLIFGKMFPGLWRQTHGERRQTIAICNICHEMKIWKDAYNAENLLSLVISAGNEWMMNFCWCRTKPWIFRAIARENIHRKWIVYAYLYRRIIYTWKQQINKASIWKVVTISPALIFGIKMKHKTSLGTEFSAFYVFLTLFMPVVKP